RLSPGRRGGTRVGTARRGARPSARGGPVVIEVDGLSKRFGPVQAVRDLSFSVADGEIFGLLGPNGAGKTTTVRMLAGLIGPTAGDAVINGHRLNQDAQRIRSITGVLTESPG